VVQAMRVRIYDFEFSKVDAFDGIQIRNRNKPFYFGQPIRVFACVFTVYKLIIVKHSLKGIRLFEIANAAMGVVSPFI
jgi:hypothetical protein